MAYEDDFQVRTIKAQKTTMRAFLQRRNNFDWNGRKEKNVNIDDDDDADVAKTRLEGATEFDLQ